MELILENVRSFVGRHAIPIKPLTFLTGENSSGKTTFLASFAVVNDPLRFPFHPSFKKSPYSLGNFETLATYKGGRAGRSDSFSLGFKRPAHSSRTAVELVAKYVGRRGLIEFDSMTVRLGDIDGSVKVTRRSGKPRLEVISSRGSEFAKTELPDDANPELLPEGGAVDFNLLLMLSTFARLTAGRKPDVTDQLLNDLSNLLQGGVTSRVLSMAPIRSKPRRTYDEAAKDFSPEGEHVPFVLSSVLDDANMRGTIERFGVESGLYTKLAVKMLGKDVSDPTQVLVSSSSRAANLVDVGYGVSQVLPVIVQSVMTTAEKLLLLQQPEVHLHPRAQAALGSLFVNLVESGAKEFIVETHSDYIIDRVRMEVARKRIPAKDVSILYFEKEGSETRVHPISLSEQGDICGAPPSYRAFFMKEELDLLRRSSR